MCACEMSGGGELTVLADWVSKEDGIWMRKGKREREKKKRREKRK